MILSFDFTSFYQCAEFSCQSELPNWDRPRVNKHFTVNWTFIDFYRCLCWGNQVSMTLPLINESNFVLRWVVQMFVLGVFFLHADINLSKTRLIFEWKIFRLRILRMNLQSFWHTSSRVYWTLSAAVES